MKERSESIIGFLPSKILLGKKNEDSKKKALLSKEKQHKKEVFLIKALNDACQNFADAYEGLQNVDDPDLIDSYIYALNAADLRCKVLLRDIKMIKK